MSEAPPSRLEQAAGWCTRLADGMMTAQEQQAFGAWVEADPANLAALEKCIRVWQGFGAVADSPEFIAVRERALATYRRRSEARWAQGPVDRSVFAHWPRLSRRAAWAASLLLLGLPGTLWWNSLPDRYSTAVGERRVVVLSDGSRLSLDADTRVDVHMDDGKRELALVYGRAKFDVAKDPMRPFSVRVDDKMVVAVGTSFSVERLRRQMHVVLFEGKVAVLEQEKDRLKPIPVRLSAATTHAESVLTPGRELVASLSQPAAAVMSVDVNRALSWENDQLAFREEPLATAIERMNRYTDRKLVLGDAATGELRVNGVFNAGDVDAFLAGLRAVFPIRALQQGDVIRITQAD